MIYKLLIFLLLNYFLTLCICFNIEELKSINYEVDISQTPLRKEDDQTSLVVHMTSIFGQEYECILPQVEEEEVSEKIPYDEKNADIKELLKPMHTGNCLLKAKDWWTYELCFGQYIKQFHIEDGQIIGQVLTLGLYDFDYDWNNETDQEKFKHTKQRYHSQYYVNGTKCDLTGQPRVAEVRIYCEEESGDYIHRVDEPGTCSYVIAVHTSRVCSHPQLKPLPSKKIQKIPCHPSLSEEQYSQYLEKLKEEKIQADLKRSQWLTNQQERLQVMKNENLLKSEIDDPKEFKKQYKTLVENKNKDFKPDEAPVRKVEKNLDKLEEKLTDNEKGVEDLIDDEELGRDNLRDLLSKEKFSLVKEGVEELFQSLIDEAGEENGQNTYSQVLDGIKKRVSEATQKLNKAESALYKDLISDAKIDSKTETKNDQNIKAKIPETEIKKEIENKEGLNEIKSDDLLKTEDADENSDDLQVRIRRLDRMHSNGKTYEIDRMQQKKLEKAIKERLEKYGVNTGGRRIEVKIIKAGYFDSHLTDEEASQFENMITALLTGEQEAIQEMERNKKLEENYKFTWEDESEDDEGD